MTNIDNFKNFVKNNPTLITHVKEGNMSWQKFYEMYDLYGEDKEIWEEYTQKKEVSSTKEIKKTSTNNNTLSNILDMAKNIDANKIQDGITSIQKAISLFSDMLIKERPETSSTYTPRPIYRRFDD